MGKSKAQTACETATTFGNTNPDRAVNPRDGLWRPSEDTSQSWRLQRRHSEAMLHSASPPTRWADDTTVFEQLAATACALNLS